MKRVAIPLAAFLLLASSQAMADLCANCCGKAYIENIGHCRECGVVTSSGQFRLCPACSTKLNKCQACLMAMNGAAVRPPTTAPASQPSTIAAARAADLKAKADSLVFAFTYVGAQDKPFYQVTLSVPDFMLDEPKPFAPVERITAGQAGKIVDSLAAGGWLDAADRVAADWDGLNPKAANGYSLRVSADKIAYAIPLGFDLKTLKAMDAIAAAVDGPAAKAMKLMIGRLSGFRKQWEAGS